MSKLWPRVRLGQVLKRSDEAAQHFANAEYMEITVRLWGKGVVERGRIGGTAVNGRRFVARTGQFIASRIDARNGAMGVVPVELDGALVSNDFPLFEIDRHRLLPQYMAWLCRTPAFVDLCARASEGTTNRVRLKEQEFLNLEISIPAPEEQRRIVERIDAVQLGLQQADQLHTSIDQDIASLLAVRFGETLEHADWRPMREVAPLVRRIVIIEPEGTYLELGVRSFFKGAFIRRTVAGAEFTWQTLYEIRTRDLIFSNIMAWERGIALAKAEHDGCIGNHRMLTCEVIVGESEPEHLAYYFGTEEGFAKVYSASLGTSARNRTLTADSLMNISVPVPPIDAQRRFVALQSELRSIREAQQNMASMRDAVVPALVSQLLSPN